MIKKRVKATKRKNSNSYTYKINLKVGEFEHDEKVAILKFNDYELLQKKIENLKINEKSSKETKQLEEQNDKLRISNLELSKDYERIKTKYQEKEKENKELTVQLNNIEENYEHILENTEKNLKHSNDKLHESIEKITKEHQDQLKQSYDQFNKDMKKYIAVNHLQNNALKQILELGFIDIIRNKHKSIAKDQIKELTNDKKIYELIEKK